MDHPHKKPCHDGHGSRHMGFPSPPPPQHIRRLVRNASVVESELRPIVTVAKFLSPAPSTQLPARKGRRSVVKHGPGPRFAMRQLCNLKSYYISLFICICNTLFSSVMGQLVCLETKHAMLCSSHLVARHSFSSQHHCNVGTTTAQVC